jgi:hypothetical protein
MEKYENFTTAKGQKVLSYEWIEQIREKEDPLLNIIPQRGGQEKAAASNADITVYGGKRGGGKTFVEVLEAIKDIRNKNFTAYILRKKKDDFRTIEETADYLLSPFGDYNKSQNDMTWNFAAGGTLSFRGYNHSYEDFRDMFQGREIAYIGIDEATQISYRHFKYLLTCNRNSKNIRNRLLMTCNPDPDSWLANFIDWWIDEDGIPIPERSGKIRYCFMGDDTVSSIVWGNTRDEVYQQCRGEIDKYWREEYSEFTTPQDMFVKSVSFIIGELYENKILLKSDPSYMANLLQQDEEQRARDLDGNWKFKTVGSDLITLEDIENFLNNTPKDNGQKYVTCDPALDGGDNAVFWKWNGWHLEDLRVVQMNSKDFVEYTESLLNLWGCSHDRFAYDLQGVGQLLKGYFPMAVPFNNQAMPTNGDRNIFKNLKSECAYRLVEKLKLKEISINPELLERKYDTRRKKKMPLRDIFIKEKKAIRRLENERSWGLPTKKDMIKMVGWSPDFIESLVTRAVFEEVKKSTKPRIKGLGFL